MSRASITRPEAVAHNPRWSEADHAVIREQLERLDRIGAVTFEVPPKRQYVVILVDGEGVASLDGGTFAFKPGWEPGHAVKVPRGNGQPGDEWALHLTVAERPENARRQRRIASAS